MIKSYGGYIAKDTPKLIQPLSINIHGLYEQWLESDKTKYPCYQDYVEAVTEENIRHY